MPVQYTSQMQKVLNDDVERRLERSLAEFPELAGLKITVGRTTSADGTASARSMTIRLNVRRRQLVSYFTIGHELTHLLQSGGLRLVPAGEVQCDVWTLARSELFLDDPPTYLCHQLWTRSNWLRHARRVRELCIEAISVRRTDRRYLRWLNDALEQHAAARPSRVQSGGDLVKCTCG